jgi:hypothetical protein
MGYDPDSATYESASNEPAGPSGIKITKKKKKAPRNEESVSRESVFNVAWTDPNPGPSYDPVHPYAEQLPGRVTSPGGARAMVVEGMHGRGMFVVAS